MVTLNYSNTSCQKQHAALLNLHEIRRLLGCLLGYKVHRCHQRNSLYFNPFSCKNLNVNEVILHMKINTDTQSDLLLEDNDVPVHELIQGLVQRDIIVLYPLC